MENSIVNIVVGIIMVMFILHVLRREIFGFEQVVSKEIDHRGHFKRPTREQAHLARSHPIHVNYQRRPNPKDSRKAARRRHKRHEGHRIRSLDNEHVNFV